jgi:antitoxin ParD1/3/4
LNRGVEAPAAPADASYFEGLRDRVRKAAEPAAKA